MKRGSHMTAESRAKMVLNHKGMKGRIMSPEARAKISATKMGHEVSIGARMKMSMAAMARDTSEWRAMISKRNWRGGKVVWMRKSRAKRRLLGFNPLNSWFLGCEGHHINPLDVIHMPKKLHQSVRHNQYTGKGMAQMNALAGAFLTEDWT